MLAMVKEKLCSTGHLDSVTLVFFQMRRHVANSSLMYDGRISEAMLFVTWMFSVMIFFLFS